MSTRTILKRFICRSARMPLIQFRHGQSASHVKSTKPLPHATYTPKLQFINDAYEKSIATYRVMDPNATVSPESIRLDAKSLVGIYKNMVTLSVMDTIMYESQRQGRISFYMTNTGEEATHFGSAAALTHADTVYAQYREVGVFLHRGFTLREMMNQCYSNVDDRTRGRQMPVHYGSKRLNCMVISSPLATQIPQAVGAAYANKLNQNGCVVIVYFGEGAASEGDTHAAFNFAATLRCPVIFFCRNNAYAISTPAREQYAGDGIAARGPGYGIQTIRVDGNDIFAVYNATTYAREYAVAENRPVLIEAMTYRLGHHSTSDDSTAYRSNDEVQQSRQSDGISRLKQYLHNNRLWDDVQETRLRSDVQKEILRELSTAETKLKPAWREMFTDVYDELTGNLTKQQNELDEHLGKYAQHYPLAKHAT